MAEYEYHPFGEELRASGRRIAHEQPLRYQSKFFDKETELTQFGFRHYTATLGRFINRDPVEEPGRWRLFAAMRHGVNNPFAGLKAIGGNWLGDFQARQDALRQNTSLPHTTEAIGTGLHKSVSMQRNASVTQKYYSANSSNTGHVGQGGTQGPEWQPMATSVRAADPSNRDRNLYGYAGNDPVNKMDALGLFAAPVFIISFNDRNELYNESMKKPISEVLEEAQNVVSSIPQSPNRNSSRWQVRASQSVHALVDNRFSYPKSGPTPDASGIVRPWGVSTTPDPTINTIVTDGNGGVKVQISSTYKETGIDNVDHAIVGGKKANEGKHIEQVLAEHPDIGKDQPPGLPILFPYIGPKNNYDIPTLARVLLYEIESQNAEIEYLKNARSRLDNPFEKAIIDRRINQVRNYLEPQEIQYQEIQNIINKINSSK